jgi:hypothetical protein
LRKVKDEEKKANEIRLALKRREEEQPAIEENQLNRPVLRCCISLLSKLEKHSVL